jgi:hypothetical protein
VNQVESGRYGRANAAAAAGRAAGFADLFGRRASGGNIQPGIVTGSWGKDVAKRGGYAMVDAVHGSLR